MALETVLTYFDTQGMKERVRVLAESSATVELAAQALGTQGCRIAKTLSFHAQDGCLLLVAAGDAKVDNKKFKETFGLKAKMLTAEEVLAATGHAVGGVCPFGIGEGIAVYLDASLKRFDTVFPACGSGNSAIELTIDELFAHSHAISFVDVCKGWQEEA